MLSFLHLEHVLVLCIFVLYFPRVEHSLVLWSFVLYFSTCVVFIFCACHLEKETLKILYVAYSLCEEHALVICVILYLCEACSGNFRVFFLRVEHILVFCALFLLVERTLIFCVILFYM